METEEKFKQDLSENSFVDIANCRSTKQQETYLKIYRENYDPFAERSSIEALGNEIFDESDHWITIKNKHYKHTDRKHHLVVILKRFIKTPDDLTEEEILDAFKVIRELNKTLQISGGAILMRYGDTRLSGASVKHLHFHVVEPNRNTGVALWTGCEID